MSREALLQKLEEIFRDVFGDDTIVLREDMDASDIDGWDSLANITILAAIQDELSIAFAIEEIVAMKNVGNILDALERKVNCL